MKKSLFLLMAALLSVVACKTYTPTNLPAERLVFGEGGGFTGRVHTWLLLENGQLFHKLTFDTTYTEIGKVTKQLAKEKYTEKTSLKLDSITLHQPGNYYYFIETTTEADTHKILWSNEKALSEAVVAYYRSLRQLAQQVEAANKQTKKADPTVDE